MVGEVGGLFFELQPRVVVITAVRRDDLSIANADAGGNAVQFGGEGDDGLGGEVGFAGT